MNPLAAAHAIADFWPAEATVSPSSGLPLCIEATRLLTAAFARAGVADVKPLPCAISLWNAPATLALSQGLEPTHSATELTVDPERLKGKLKGGGWNGHLIVEHPEWLMDVVLGGLVRSLGSPPGFESVGPIVARKHHELRWADGAWWGATSDLVTLRIEPRRRLAAWRKTPAWRGEPEEEIVAALVEAMTG